MKIIKSKSKHPGGRSETEKAYVAGIIDGEGSFYLGAVKNISKPYSEKFYSSTLSVEMGCKSVPEWLHNNYGGGLYSRIRHGRNYEMWIWKANGVLAEKITKEIYPYLVEKRKEAEIFLEFRKTIIKSMRRKKMSKGLVEKRDGLIRDLRSSRKVYA